MPERPDLRKIAADIREALESYPREALADILTYVFQAYVVEGMPTVAATQPDRLPDLEGLSFAEVVSALQTRLDLPELSLFEVNAGRVSLRVGGQLVQLAIGHAASEAQSSTPSSPPVVPPEPPPRPGVRVEEVPSSQLRPPPRQPAAPAEAPPPRRGLSINTPSAGGGGAARPAAPATQAGPQQPAPAAPAQPATQAGARPAAPGAPGGQAQPQPKDANTPEGDDDGGSKRFSLLDLD